MFSISVCFCLSFVTLYKACYFFVLKPVCCSSILCLFLILLVFIFVYFRTDSIFCQHFLQLMQQEEKVLGLSCQFSTLISLLQSEAGCSKTLTETQGVVEDSNSEINSRLISKETSSQSSRGPVIDHKNKDKVVFAAGSESSNKRKTAESSVCEENTVIKKQKLDERNCDYATKFDSVPFYHHINKLKKNKIPR